MLQFSSAPRRQTFPALNSLCVLCLDEEWAADSNAVFPESVQGVSEIFQHLTGSPYQCPVLDGGGGWRTTAERDKEAVFALRAAGDRYQITGRGNRSCAGGACDHSRAQMANRPPGREATSLAHQVTLGDRKSPKRKTHDVN